MNDPYSWLHQQSSSQGTQAYHTSQQAFEQYHQNLQPQGYPSSYRSNVQPDPSLQQHQFQQYEQQQQYPLHHQVPSLQAFAQQDGDASRSGLGTTEQHMYRADQNQGNLQPFHQRESQQQRQPEHHLHYDQHPSRAFASTARDYLPAEEAYQQAQLRTPLAATLQSSSHGDLGSFAGRQPPPPNLRNTALSPPQVFQPHQPAVQNGQTLGRTSRDGMLAISASSEIGQGLHTVSRDASRHLVPNPVAQQSQTLSFRDPFASSWQPSQHMGQASQRPYLDGPISVAAASSASSANSDVGSNPNLRLHQPRPSVINSAFGLATPYQNASGPAQSSFVRPQHQDLRTSIDSSTLSQAFGAPHARLSTGAHIPSHGIDGRSVAHDRSGWSDAEASTSRRTDVRQEREMNGRASQSRTDASLWQQQQPPKGRVSSAYPAAHPYDSVDPTVAAPSEAATSASASRSHPDHGANSPYPSGQANQDDSRDRYGSPLEARRAQASFSSLDGAWVVGQTQSKSPSAVSTPISRPDSQATSAIGPSYAGNDPLACSPFPNISSSGKPGLNLQPSAGLAKSQEQMLNRTGPQQPTLPSRSLSVSSLRPQDTPPMSLTVAHAPLVPSVPFAVSVPASFSPLDSSSAAGKIAQAAPVGSVTTTSSSAIAPPADATSSSRNPFSTKQEFLPSGSGAGPYSQSSASSPPSKLISSSDMLMGHRQGAIPSTSPSMAEYRSAQRSVSSGHSRSQTHDRTAMPPPALHTRALTPPTHGQRNQTNSASQATVLESPDPLNILTPPAPTSAIGYHPSAFYADPAASGSPRAPNKRKADQDTIQISSVKASKQRKKKDDATPSSATGKAPSSAGGSKASEPVIEVVIPLTNKSGLPTPKAVHKSKPALVAPRPPSTPQTCVYVEIPMAATSGLSSKKKSTAPSRDSQLSWNPSAIRNIVIDSDSEQDAEGSDWDDLDLLESWSTPKSLLGDSAFATPLGAARVSSGPVKTSVRKVPMAKLRGMIEDLFEADDSLPDADTLRSMAPAQPFAGPADAFFEVIQQPSDAASGYPVAVLRFEVLQKLLKFVRQCSRPLHEISGPARTTASGKPMDLASLPLQDLVRLCGILDRTIRISEDLDPFPAQTTKPGAPMSGGVKKGMKRGKTKGGESESPPVTTPPPPEGSSTGAADGGGNSLPGCDDAKASLTRDESLDELNRKLAAATRSTLAAECCLAVLAGDKMPKPLLSEDLLRSCFDAIKTSLDKIILPFIEGCASGVHTRAHPILTALIQALAPQKARKKKTQGPREDPALGMAVICRDTLSRLFRHVCSALYQVQRLVRIPDVSLSDSGVISAVYFSLGPFFVMEPDATSSSGSSEAAKASAAGRAAMASLGGANAMKSLRLPALNLLRDIFAKHADQRQWIIEEILTSLTKLTDMKKNRRHYSLRNGKSMHSVNALLLQLIQAAAHGIPQQVESVVAALKSRQGRQRGDREEDPEDDELPIASIDAAGQGAESDTEDEVLAEMEAWRRGLEGAHQSAKAIVLFLLQRVGQTKVARSSPEMSHVSMIENIIHDLLNVLYMPDWPAAALLLSCFCRLFGACLEDSKANPETKGVALDHLGTVAARVRQSQLRFANISLDNNHETDFTEGSVSPSTPPLDPADENVEATATDLSIAVAIRSLDTDIVDRFVHAYRSIFVYLAQSDNDSQAMESSMEFLQAQVQGELATAFAKVRERLDDAVDNDAPSLEIARIHRFGKCLEDAVEKVRAWSLTDADVSIAVTEDSFQQMLILSERLTVSSSMMVSYSFMHAQLVEALDGQSVGNRSKALRGLGSINAIDPDLLDAPSVRSAVEIRLRDSSTIVRETAVGLLGKYVLRKTGHIERYYEQLAGRIYDAGLAVRKRVLRLLKSIHFASKSDRIRTDSCARIVRCINDEDKVVQELAIATIGEMWLPAAMAAARTSDDLSAVPGHSDAVVSAKEEVAGEADGFDGHQDIDAGMTETINTIMSVAEVIRERPSPLEEVFRRLLRDRREPEANDLLSKLQQLSDSMIDTLVESSEGSTKDTVNRIKTVQLLVSTNPSILTIAKAKLLLPYLKAAQTAEEVQIMELLLRIFRACLPWMPKTALAFAEALEKSLTPLVSRPPPAAHLQTLQELIACFCTVIVSHTHNFKILARTLKACFSRLQQMRAAAASGKKIEEIQSWNRITSLTALLCEHADFDAIRQKYPEAAADINAISTKPIVDVVSETLLAIYKTSSGHVRSYFLQNLGFLFRAYPSLMTRGQITHVMDEIFDDGSVPDRAMLLRIILDFLDADSAKRNPDAPTVPTHGRKATNDASSSVDMTVLVGNTESFADTGVGSAMMQRYVDAVLKASLEIEHPMIQRSATEILRFTVMQGLSHPIQCVPYLVALETTNDAGIRAKALQLHSHISSKHASLVQARFLDSAKTAFRFQLKQTKPQTVRGFMSDADPSAMLNGWYSLLRDRRNTRLDFLRQIVKALDVNTAASDCDTEEVLFARFIADNLATLDYKTLEELFIVIGELRSILAVSGMQVLFMVQSTLRKSNAAGSTQLGTEQAEREVLGQASDAQLRNDVEGPPLANAPQDAGIDAVLAGTATDAAAASLPKSEALARMSIVSGMALLLRNHLKHIYNLGEARCAKFNPTKKQSAGADRPATRRALQDASMAALSFDAMPLGLELIDGETDAFKQLETYASIIENEGTVLEPEDPEMMEDLGL